MHPRLFPLAAALFCLQILAAGGAHASGVLGRWLTESGNAQVEIQECAGRLCGRVVWLKEPLNEEGTPKRDRHNPDPGLRARPIIGLAMLENFVPDDDPGKWRDGTIYNPEDGKTYSCTLTLQDDGRLRVRGYVGLPLFGKTQIWTRAP
ncbi:MAG: DUF2147 domain-containing protein [Alphaproteobacteria bacterium]|nr:DUF2147 domain-containing protein [Alphaproteobacteria bacterium]